MVQEILNKFEWLFSELVFKEEEHTYNLNGTYLPSVSSLVKRHETFVDFKAIAKAVAKRDNMSVEDVHSKWDKIKVDACALGHETHSYAEFYDGTQQPSNELEKAAKKFFDELPSYYKVISKELRMFSKEFKYAGTADLILLDTRTNTIVIADFKTNKDLWKSYHMLQPPFENLEQNNFNKYQFQLSYYQLMIEQSEYEVSNRVLIWLRRDGEYEIHATKDLTTELRKFLINNPLN